MERTIQDTSIDAYRDFQADGTEDSIAIVVENIVKKFGKPMSVGMIADEYKRLTKTIDRQRNEIAKRVSVLRDQNVFEVISRQKCPIYKRDVYFWDIKGRSKVTIQIKTSATQKNANLGDALKEAVDLLKLLAVNSETIDKLETVLKVNTVNKKKKNVKTNTEGVS